MQLELAKPRSQVFAQVDLKDAVITIQDGTATPKTVTVKVGEGNLTYSEKRNIQYSLDKGKLDEVRLGDEIPMEVDFGFQWIYVQPGSGQTSAGVVTTIEDALKKIGPCSTWVSTDSDPCRPYSVDIKVVLTGPCTSRNQTLTFPDFRWESLNHDLKGAQITCQGKCNATNAVVDHN